MKRIKKIFLFHSNLNQLRIIMQRSVLTFLLFYFSLIIIVSAQEDNMYVPRPIKISPASSEVGIFLGGSYYTGDLNPSGHFNRFTRPAAGGLYRMNFNSRFSTKIIGSYGTIEANDAYSSNVGNHNRNLSFKSKIMELAVEGEFNFLPYSIGAKKSAISTPYIFSGVAVYHFNPKGYYQGRWYNLQPIGTEGQGSVFSNNKTYSLTQFAIPFGAGVKINIAKRIGINFEWGIRKTFTDYLDDVSGKYVDLVLLESEKGAVAAALSDKSLVIEGGSNAGRQRGNSFTKDWYAFAGVIITFKINEKEGCDVPH
ncbi:MAG: DUF6089 family protein [Bacteroidota bacterium]